MKDQQMTKKKIHDLEQQETLACVDAMDENGVFHLFRKAAELFSSCMNDYLYVYDITNDTYYITERATERFDLPGSILQAEVFHPRRVIAQGTLNTGYTVAELSENHVPGNRAASL